MLAVSRAHQDLATLPERKRKRILDGVAELLQDEVFIRTITLATSDTAQIRTRVGMVQNIISTNV